MTKIATLFKWKAAAEVDNGINFIPDEEVRIIGARFIMISTAHYIYPQGTILTLYDDDNTSNPEFKCKHIGTSYVTWCKVIPYYD